MGVWGGEAPGLRMWVEGREGVLTSPMTRPLTVSKVSCIDGAEPSLVMTREKWTFARDRPRNDPTVYTLNPMRITVKGPTPHMLNS